MVSGNLKKNVPEWLNSSLWSSKSIPVTPRAQKGEVEASELQVPKSEYGQVWARRIRSKERGDNLEESSENPSTSEDGVNNEGHRTETGCGKDIKSGDGERPDGSGPNIQKSVDCVADKESEVWCPDELGSPTTVASLVSIPGHSTPFHSLRHTHTGSSSFDTRVGQFYTELSRKSICIPDLQRLASQGIPDYGGIRAMTWKLLLGYLPTNHNLWGVELVRKRAEYAAFQMELLVTPSEVTRRKDCGDSLGSIQETKGLLQRHEITHEDHPLSLGKTSVWNQYFLDSEVCEQIDRDVKRTHPDMHFFCGDSAVSIENQESMKRALFIFAKLNPGIRYVQGMNEVLAPLFYVFKTDPDEGNSANAEADAFFCFVILLSGFRDHFCQQLDNSAVGIRSTIARLTILLRRQDEELWRHLELTSKVNPQFFAFRWITLLLTQEFSFPDCLRLWDSLLSNLDGPLEILLRVCCAMLISVRSHLLAGDFTSNLKLLQHYPSVDIHRLLQLADELKIRNLE
eukprot:c27495_g1_i1 orf=620-2161(+)